jgi:hypothetical protein
MAGFAVADVPVAMCTNFSGYYNSYSKNMLTSNNLTTFISIHVEFHGNEIKTSKEAVG